MAGETEKTSLKQLFQGMIKDDVEVLQGIVKSVNPLKIQIEGDEKLTIGENITYIPRHLTDYKTELSFDEKTKHKITVYNALKVGEEVYILGFNRGKQYYVLDRVVV